MHAILFKRSLAMTAVILAAGFIAAAGSVPRAQATCSAPSQVLDLTNWKQTLPIGSSKRKPTEISQPTLANFAHPEFFRPNETCDGVVFRAPVSGVTTSGSGYPRSELREMTENGKQLAGWSTKSGTHTMVLEQAITAVPRSKAHVVAGQIHNGDDDVLVIRLENPTLFVDIGGKRGPVLDSQYVLGKKFSVKFVATAGKIRVYYNGQETPVYTMKKKGKGNYFKVGAYTQSNCSKERVCDESNYGEVIVYKLLVDHQAVANAVLPFSTALARVSSWRDGRLATL